MEPGNKDFAENQYRTHRTMFDLFVEEITTVDFGENAGGVDLAGYNQKSNYKARLITLQQGAITEILKNTDAISFQLERLKQANQRLNEFWDWYSQQWDSRSREPGTPAPIIENPYFSLELERFFNILNDPRNPVTYNLFTNLHDSAMLKHGVLEGLISQVQNIVSKASEAGIQTGIGLLSKPVGFQTNIGREKVEPLRKKLVEFGYIAPETDFQSFEACFSDSPAKDSFKRVKWIKRPKRGKTATAKKALTDLLELIGTPVDQRRDKIKIETFFADSTGAPLKFTASNFDNSKDHKLHSEFFPELQAIIQNL